MEMSPQPTSPADPKKSTSTDPKNSLVNDYSQDIGTGQNSSDSEDDNDKKCVKKDRNNVAASVAMIDKSTPKCDGSEAIVSEKSNNLPLNNIRSKSNTSQIESVDTSRQGQATNPEINTIYGLLKADDTDSGPNDEDSDGEDDSEEDSSDEDGSEGSDTPRAEDTVSISDSDQEPTESQVSTLQTPRDIKNKDNKELSNNLDRNGEIVHNSKKTEVHEIISDSEDCPELESKSISNQYKAADVPRRRSDRAVKRRNYSISVTPNGNANSDLELLSTNALPNQKRNKNEPIVVNDTKALVEMAANQMKANNGTKKKEPTLVIIDTNSLMPSNRSLSTPHEKKNNITSSVSAEDLYQSIAARGTTVTPVHPRQASTSVQTTQAPVILPSLTDDMFVVEAPSFIVPYVYEKPSIKAFRKFVDVLGKELEKLREKEEVERLSKEKVDKDDQDKGKKDIKEEPSGNKVETEENDVSKSTSDIQPEEISKSKKHKKNRKRHGIDEDDASWDGQSSSDSEDEAISDDDQGTTIVIKDKEDDSLENLKKNITANFTTLESKPSAVKSDNYFENALGKFFTNIGLNLVQEYVQTDLLKQQKRKLHKELKTGETNTKPIESAIHSLTKNLEFSKENNAPYTFSQKKCKFCTFKTESFLVMSHHMETPHMKNNVYTCNFCPFEIKSPHDILYHMEEQHNTRGRLERAPAYHQCANCPFEDNGKGKLARHMVPCAKKFKPELNLAPPVEWEPPAKIPRMTRARNSMMSSYQAAFNRAQVGTNLTSRPPINMANMLPNMVGNFRPRGRSSTSSNPRGVPPPLIRSNMMRQNILPPHYPLMNSQSASKSSGASKLLQHQPSISITPLPRAPLPVAPPPAQQQQANSKGSFVICEICDGYIKDLMTLRNHMQWIHKVKIHVKMIYNRPPLNCQKCQFRFFTDQGLERHLLGSHGLVTSSMQEAANKGKDAGRCPICGRVYQWKLLNHVARDHNLTLKPAHLSYKCTVCTATFGMYKQFENHVYSAHSVVAKRVMDKSKSAPPVCPKAAAAPVSLANPLKINDEITIIPQPTPAAKGKKD